MQPVAVSPEAERGYYVIWNAETWARMRVSCTALVLCSCTDPIVARAHALLRGSRDLPRTPSGASFLGAKMWALRCSRIVFEVLSAKHDGRCATGDFVSRTVPTYAFRSAPINGSSTRYSFWPTGHLLKSRNEGQRMISCSGSLHLQRRIS